jgi:hypothetical protein
MVGWLGALRYNPVPALLSSGHEALVYAARRDLLGEGVGPVEALWDLPEVADILRRQGADGAWRYPGRRKNPLPQEDMNQLETFRMLGVLVEKYSLTDQHPAIQEAARYLFACQTDEGDIRGILGTQYAPHYTAGMMELLIKAGYSDVPPIERGFAWLLSIRQDDGGWAWPVRTAKVRFSDAAQWPDPVQPDRSKPFSHVLTGVVLRAFAAHPTLRHTEAAQHAGSLLASRFFRPDKYTDRRDRSYWEKVSFPFWFTDLVSALDSLSHMGFGRDDAQIQAGLDWLRNRQREDGLWQLQLLRTGAKDTRLWVSLAVARVFRRWYG